MQHTSRGYALLGDDQSPYPGLCSAANPGQIAYTFSNEGYLNLRPVSSREATGSAGGTSPLLYIGLALVGAIVIGVVVVLVRRGSAEDRA